MKAKSGFTLVEILIVVVILGILAAIVIPQFSDASSQANMSKLQSDLQMLRSQVQLYRVQHNDNLPSIDSVADFENRLTQKTDRNGNLDSGGAFGPYMMSVPKNPFVDDDADLFSFSNSAPDGETSHWHVNTSTGAIYANCDQGRDL